MSENFNTSNITDHIVKKHATTAEGKRLKVLKKEKKETDMKYFLLHLHGRVLTNSEQGLLLHQLRRRLSVTIIRAQSSCLLSRLGHFQPGARQAAKRRAITKQREEQLNQDQRAHFLAHVRGRRIHETGSLWI